MSAQPAEATRTDELTDEAIVAWARRTRAAKGLLPKITDPATLRRIVVLALGPRPSNGSNRDQT